VPLGTEARLLERARAIRLGATKVIVNATAFIDA